MSCTFYIEKFYLWSLIPRQNMDFWNRIILLEQLHLGEFGGDVVHPTKYNMA